LRVIATLSAAEEEQQTQQDEYHGPEEIPADVNEDAEVDE
jgi:hypothetical protein